MNKKGLGLNNAFGAVMMLVLIGVLVIVALVVFTNLNDVMVDGSGGANVTNDLIDSFENKSSSLMGVVGTVIFLGLVIGILVASFTFRGRRKNGLGNDENEGEEKDENDEEEEKYECDYCEKDILEEEEKICNHCEGNICINCRRVFGEYNYCKECYEEIMKKTEKVKEVKKEVEIKEDVEPIIDYDKNKFEGKTKYD